MINILKSVLAIIAIVLIIYCSIMFASIVGEYLMNLVECIILSIGIGTGLIMLTILVCSTKESNIKNLKDKFLNTNTVLANDEKYCPNCKKVIKKVAKKCKYCDTWFEDNKENK